MTDSILLSVAAVYLVLVLLTVSLIDSRRLVIPNALNAAHAGGGLVFAGLLKPMCLVPSLVGGALGFGALLVFRSGYQRIRGRDGLGFGDVKFMAGAGLWVGWQGLAPLLLVASASALAYVAVRGMSGCRLDPPGKLPFGPFLSLGTCAIWSIQVAGVAPWMKP